MVKEKCNICGGTGIDPRTTPREDCEECNGTGYKSKEKEDDTT